MTDKNMTDDCANFWNNDIKKYAIQDWNMELFNLSEKMHKPLTV